ncbi:MAG: glycosyltransferase family 4 protein [Acidimicrobiales bacterium]
MTSVLLVVSTSDRRGAEVFATHLADRLRAEPRAGTDATTVDVVALAPGTGANQLPIDALGPGRTHPSTLLALVRAVRSHDVAVSNGGTTLWPVAAAAMLARRPFVYRNIGDPAAWGTIRGAGLRIGLPLRRAAAVAALYPTAAEELITRYRLRRERVTIIANGVPEHDYVPVGDEARRSAAAALGLRDDLRWVGYVGALSPEKRPLLALEAVAGDDRLGIVVAGDGPQMDDCRRLADRHPERIRLLGRVASSRTVIDAVSAVVLPSRTEGISGVAIEAALCEVPVVTTAVGGMADVVADGRSGRVLHEPSATELADAMWWAAGRRSELGAAGRRIALERFTLDIVARRWADLLERALGRGAGDGAA